MRSTRRNTLVAAVSLILVPLIAGAQSSVAVSPFVAYVPSATSNPLAGFSLTFGGTTGLALRSGAELSINNPEPTGEQGGYRPWGADADAMLFLGGLGGGATVFSRSLSPYLFSGIGMTGGDSAGVNVVRHSWSYGVGATIPLGLDADLFAESRWRLNEFVLPTSKGAPDSKSELRFGLSFHVGGSREPRRAPRRRPRYDDDEYAVVPAPQPQTVVVQQPVAPPPQTVVVTPAQPQTVIVQQAPPPQTVIVQEAPPQPRTVVNVNLPGSRRTRRGSSHHQQQQTQRVYVQNPSTRVVAQQQNPSPRVVVQQQQARTTSSTSARSTPQRSTQSQSRPTQVRSTPAVTAKGVATRKRTPDQDQEQ